MSNTLISSNNGLDRIDAKLRLLRRLPGVTGALVASMDGHPLASDLSGHSAGAAAAVVASSLALAERLGELTGAAGLEELQVRTSLGYASVHAVNNQLVLAVITNHTVNLARLRLDIREVIAALAADGRAFHS